MSNSFKIKKKKALTEEEQEALKTQKKERKQSFSANKKSGSFHNVSGKSTKDFSRKKT